MICGRRLRTGFWLALALLCLSSGLCFAQSYDGPDLPPGWYPMHETELTALETILAQQLTQLEGLEMQLTRAQKALRTADSELLKSERAHERLGISLDELETAVNRLTLQRNIAIGAGAAAIVAVVLLAIF